MPPLGLKRTRRRVPKSAPLRTRLSIRLRAPRNTPGRKPKEGRNNASPNLRSARKKSVRRKNVLNKLSMIGARCRL